mmetsp:Transcript_173944/g.557571  ORF Transcript_173944/g.557571 Transcript_173944/m.557571 type:complete len:493 (+) Transcript_173944:77-1555(+)
MKRTSSCPMRPLHGAAGIARDIGDKAFNSIAPSPKTKKGVAWPSIFSAQPSIRLDPWLGHLDNQGPQCMRPPNIRTYERFKVRFDKFLAQVQHDPQKLRRDVDRLRAKLPVGYPIAAAADLARDCYCLGNARDSSQQASKDGLMSAAPPRGELPASQPIPARALVGNGAQSCSRDGRVEGVARKVVMRPAAIRTSGLSEEATQRLQPPSPSPMSPSVVSDADEHPRSLQQNTLPLSSPGLPTVQECTTPFSPPLRRGWVPLQTGSWQQHPDKEHWLFKPQEGVYFHIPSDTLWRESEDAFSGGSSSSKVRIELAVGCGDIILPPSLQAHHDSGGIGASPAYVSLPGRGWKPLPDRTWQSHLRCPGWLYEPDESVFFHEQSESLWRADSEGEDAEGNVQVRRVDGGAQGLPGTPEAASPRSRSMSPQPLVEMSRRNSRGPQTLIRRNDSSAPSKEEGPQMLSRGDSRAGDSGEGRSSSKETRARKKPGAHMNE